MYACVVKNEYGTWDIYRVLNYPIPQEKEQILIDAVASGLPIVPMNLTEYRDAAATGATWTGTEWVGGHKVKFPDEYEWDATEIYSYVCNNQIIMSVICMQPNHKEQYAAIFSEETTIVDIPDDQPFKVGDIWDGENIIQQ